MLYEVITERLVFLREGLKVTFTLTLTVVLMLSLLAAIYGALMLSRRLEKVRKEAKSGDPGKRKEVEQLEQLLAHLERNNFV